jgi:MFS family permease
MSKTQMIKNTWILYLAAFLSNFGIGLINFTLIFFVHDKFNAGSAVVGWMSALWALAYLFGCLFLNSFRDRLKPGRSIILAATTMGLSVTLIPNLNSLPLLISTYMFFGLCTSLYWPSLMGWLSRGREGKKLGNALALFNLSWSSGVALSPYIAGLILRKNISLPLYISALLYAFIVIMLLLVTLFVNEYKPQKKKSEVVQEEVDESSPLRFAGWIGVISAYLVYGTLLFIFPLFAKKEWHMSEDKIGLILLLRAFASVLGFQISGYSKWWHHNKLQLYISQFLLVGLCFLLFLIQNPQVMIIVMTIFGFLFSHLYANSIFHGVSGSIDREKRMALHEAFLTVGMVAGSAGGGTIYEQMSIQITFLFCAAAVFIGLLLQIFWTEKITAK